jgi:hypothetical protein
MNREKRYRVTVTGSGFRIALLLSRFATSFSFFVVAVGGIGKVQTADD